MEFDNLQFNKRDRHPVTDSETQISAEEWNALGKKVREISLNGGGTGADLTVESSWDETEYTEYPTV